jgi:RHS repeat-associated protein
VVHVAGYDQQATGIAPAGDTPRGAVSNLLAGLEVSDRYQDLPGPSAPASASSTTTAAAQVLTIALSAAATTTRYGYTGETDTAAFTQTSTGRPAGTSLTLPGGTLYTTTPGGTPTWAHANLHGDVITTDNTGTRTWTGYWGPYGEPASTTAGGTPGPTDTTDPGTTLGYNATQGKLTDGPLILMGARPYQPDQGRFLTVDPIDGGCANPYTYAYGDPVNHPDLTGQGWWHNVTCFASKHRVLVGIAFSAIAIVSGGIALAAGAGTLALWAGAAGTAAGLAASAGDIGECIRNEDRAFSCSGAALGVAAAAGGALGLFERTIGDFARNLAGGALVAGGAGSGEDTVHSLRTRSTTQC